MASVLLIQLSINFNAKMTAMKLFKSLFFTGLLLITSSGYAIPALQLGPEPGNSDWFYNTINQTWSLTGNSGNVFAYANAIDGNGSYAWGTGTELREAYLSIAATPKTNVTPAFEVTVLNDGGVTLIESGVGSPPLADADDLKNHDLSPHGVFDTYYEIYRFVFDGTVDQIHDTQPGGTGTGNGYMEMFNITIDFLAADIEGIHFDLFTINDPGNDDYGDGSGDQVLAFAPFSHDAAFVPEPNSLALIGFGLIVFSIISRRKASLIMNS